MLYVLYVCVTIENKKHSMKRVRELNEFINNKTRSYNSQNFQAETKTQEAETLFSNMP